MLYSNIPKKVTKSALLIFAPQFEEIEAITPIDLLRRANINVTTASLTDSIHVTGRNNITIHADTTLNEVIGQNFDILILPGGPGTQHLKNDARVIDLVKKYHQNNAVAAICAAPTVLNKAGVLNKKNYTAHSSTIKELPSPLPYSVVIDGNIITSKGPGTAIDFALAIIEYLTNTNTKQRIQHDIEYENPRI